MPSRVELRRGTPLDVARERRDRGEEPIERLAVRRLELPAERNRQPRPAARHETRGSQREFTTQFLTEKAT
jgi:hypothetical protein